MQFDLFTFLASLFNFIVLLVLLRVFLFKRITRAMAERERRIAERWDDAAEKRSAAEQAQSEYEARLAEVEQRRREMLEAARAEVAETKQRELDAARDEIESQREQWRSALAEEREALGRSIEREMARQTAANVRETFEAFAGTELFEMMVRRFLSRLEYADAETTAPFRNENLTIATSEALDPAMRQKTTDALAPIEAAGLEFTVDEELVCGIELTGGGSRLDWSIGGRLEEIERVLGERLSVGKNA